MDFNKLMQTILLTVVMVLLACGQQTATNQDTGIEAPEPTPTDTASTNTAPTNTPSTVDSVSYQGVDVSHFQGDVDWAAVKALQCRCPGS